MNQPFLEKDLVLLGGGHSHAIALRLFGMKPLPRARLTLLTETSDTPYSGMLPGHVAGFYSRDQCHIDLRSLAAFAGAQFYQDQAIGLDLEAQQIICAHRPPVRFDLLSINIGSTPQPPKLLGDLAAVIAAKPVRDFLQKWQAVVEQMQQQPQQPFCLGIVGGGAGGVELALTTQRRLRAILDAAQAPLTNLTIHLFQRGDTLLPHHNRWVQRTFQQLLTQRQIQLHLSETVVAVRSGKVECQSGLVVGCDAVIWVTQAAAPPWLQASGLAVDERGFIQVDSTLRSISHPHVFAAGDIATVVNHPRPKAGVFAVRQGKPLAENLRCALAGQPLRTYLPQKRYLSLIGTADGSAVASWAAFGWRSPLLWQWKDWIDRRFMRLFSQLPGMEMDRDRQVAHSRKARNVEANPLTNLFAPALAQPEFMRCAGCGAKVGSVVLERALQQARESGEGRKQLGKTGWQAIARSGEGILEAVDRGFPSILVGLDAADDAAVMTMPTGMALVQTVDYLPALLNDPYVFGQIATNHALSDLYAMGAQPHSALAIATLPAAVPKLVEETLYQLLSGVLEGLQADGAALIGGHSTIGSEMALGIACNGWVDPDRLLRKGGMKPGDRLILTKPLGVGVLFAAAMRRQGKPAWLDAAIAMMLRSNRAAMECLQRYGATACTDITGFGLLGHLAEMLRATPVAVQLTLEAIPFLDGALELAQAGIVSSLYPENMQALQQIQNLQAVQSLPQCSLLVDPQTAGGLLASVPEATANRCLADLKTQGDRESAIIGKVLPPVAAPPIWIV